MLSGFIILANFAAGKTRVMHIPDIIRKINGAEIFYIVAVVLLSLLMLCLRYTVNIMGDNYVVQGIAYSITEAGILMMPYLLLPPRIRRVQWIFIIGLLTIVYPNILFYRYTHGMITGTMMCPSSINIFVLAGALRAVRFSDIFIALGIALAIFLNIRQRKSINRDRIGIRFKIAATALFIVTGITATSLFFHNSRAKFPSFRERSLTNIIQTRWHWDNTETRFRNFSFVGYLYYSMRAKNKYNIRIDDRAAREIVGYFDREQPPLSQMPVPRGDSSQPDNLILIIVESLNSTVLELDSARSIVPFMSRLAADSATLFAPRVLSNAGAGRSSDGQLILNTGLLPVKEGIFSLDYAGQRLPSLPRALKGYTSAEVIGEGRNQVWNHSLTTVSFGFDRLYDDIASHDLATLKPAPLQDSVIMDSALRIAARLPQPFYMQITTISMHDPYDSPSDPDRRGLAAGCLRDMDPRDRNYLLSAAQFDDALNRFVAGLKKRGLYDNTIIAVTGDHEASKTCLTDMLNSDCVPLLIINSGTGARIDNTVEQIDIFPTLLDMLGVDRYIPDGKKFGYRGTGTSLLRDPSRHDDTDTARRMSDIVIRGNFFN